MTPSVHITVLADRGDERGSSFSTGNEWPAFLPLVKDMHITSLKPGHTRGNHFHSRKKEVIAIIHHDEWTLYWDSGPETGVQKKIFRGPGAVLITVEPLTSHAVVNSGKQSLYTIGLTGEPFDSDDPDTCKREIAPKIR